MTYTIQEQALGLVAAAELLAAIDPNMPAWVQVSSNQALTIHPDVELSPEEAEGWARSAAAALEHITEVPMRENDPDSGFAYDVSHHLWISKEPMNGWKVSIAIPRRATVPA